MLERVRELPGDTLPLDAYLADFQEYYAAIPDRLDKFERAQYFEELNDPSWQAFASGNWEESLRLDELERENIAELFNGFKKREVISRRVRVVEFPITPYMQWELNGLKIWVECGENLRIITPEFLEKHEKKEPLPEVIILGPPVMYEILYDTNSALCGGRKIVNPGVIEVCRNEIEELYNKGEDFLSFFEREIKPLSPPAKLGF